MAALATLGKSDDLLSLCGVPPHLNSTERCFIIWHAALQTRPAG